MPAPGEHTRESRLLSLRFRGQAGGHYVEVGALDGVVGSHTHPFEKIGWRCLLVEADPEMAALCRVSRPAATVVHAAAVGPGMPAEVSFEVMEHCRQLSSLAIQPDVVRRASDWGLDATVRRTLVPARMLDAILEDWNPARLDFVTLDVEGHELSVLQGFTLSRWRPRVVVVERNRSLPDWHVLRHMHENGYVHVRTTGVNDWYQPGASESLRYRARLLLGFEAPLVARSVVGGLARRALDVAGLRRPTARLIHGLRRRLHGL